MYVLKLHISANSLNLDADTHVHVTYRVQYYVLSSFYNQWNWSKDMGGPGYRVKKDFDHQISLFPTSGITCLAPLFQDMIISNLTIHDFQI